MSKRQEILASQDKLIDSIIERSKELTDKEYDYLRETINEEFTDLLEKSKKLPAKTLKTKLKKLNSSINTIIDNSLVSEFAELPEQYEELKALQEDLFSTLGYKNIDQVDFQSLKSVSKLSFNKLGGTKQILKKQIAKQLKYANFTKFESPKDIIIFTEKALGKYRHYAYTIAVTSTAIADRAIANDIADAVNVKWAFYQGPKDKLNRPVCRDILSGIHPNTRKPHGKYWHIDEIKEIDNGQLPNALETAGGFGCRHRWAFVSAEMNAELNKKYNKA